MTKRILIVDDEDDIRDVVQVSLEEFAGWQTLSAASGMEALCLATFPLALAMPQAGEIFTVVTFIVVTSVLVQGFSLAPVARWLNVGIEA